MHDKTKLVEEARAFALEAHADQPYGAHPYHFHLDAVADLVEEHGEVAQVVAYLHDVVEDTEADLARIEERFGPFAAECVALLTDEPGRNRAERKRRTYAKMAAVTGDAELALVVKAADRLANLRACVADDNAEKLAMYKEEHPAFRDAVFRADLCFDLWNEMDGIVRASGESV